MYTASKYIMGLSVPGKPGSFPFTTSEAFVSSQRLLDFLLVSQLGVSCSSSLPEFGYRRGSPTY
jgi:hypothetical protein